ncbi:hypothetical protein Ahia01_000845400, partial [Argonauta hians]
SSIPVYFLWLRYMSWFSYCTELIVINQWQHVKNITCFPDERCQYPTGQSVLDYLHFAKDDMSLNLILLISLFILYRFAAYVALLIRVKYYTKSL